VLGVVALLAGAAAVAWAGGGCGGCGCANRDALAQAAAQFKSYGAECPELQQALACQVECNLGKI
jgi:hypothetical protein